MDKIEKKIKDGLIESSRLKNQVAKSLSGDIKKLANLLIKICKAGGKVVLCGNGGSAADAQHIAGELVGRFMRERKAIPAISLSTDTSVLTALANDYGYDTVFARQVEALVTKKDVVIGFSTSGNSANVIKAIEKANKIGAKTIAFTGKSGGKLNSIVDICIKIPSDKTYRIQECHITIGHILCDLVESSLCETD
ncbi:MAG: D-sedoheptulose 7-phosphate isomerase [Candidatus Firestonebacteria bacterium]